MDVSAQTTLATCRARPDLARASSLNPEGQCSRGPAAANGVRPGIGVMQYGRVATLVLIVGLPGAGKTTQARELAAQHHAIRLTPDEWMIPLFGLCWREPLARGKRDVLEGRLIATALQALGLETSVVLDFGFWGRDERSALRWLARSAGASCQVVYLPVDRGAQLARIAHRQASAPHQTYLMTEADIDRSGSQQPDSSQCAVPVSRARRPGSGR
jgi:predicted kinase